MNNLVSAAITAALLTPCLAHALHAETGKGNRDAFTLPGSDFSQKIIRRIFQDSNGNMWFGGEGAYRHNGNALEQFDLQGAYGGAVVRAIAEDADGDIWFGAYGGIVKYDGDTFTTLTEDDGLINNDVWSLAIDTRGIIWAGTLEGVSRFDGDAFTTLDIPESEPDHSRGVTSARIVHAIMEDSRGRMWFGTNGGAWIYDGNALSHVSEEDGLCNNVINDMLEDKAGNVWFATHHNGVCRYDGKSFTHVSEPFDGTEAWEIYEDREGNIWFTLEHAGLFKYDGTSFASYYKEEGLDLAAIHSILQDSAGRIWVGGYLGAYRLDGDSFVKVTKDGRW